jgi:hypothetical protein
MPWLCRENVRTLNRVAFVEVLGRFVALGGRADIGNF